MRKTNKHTRLTFIIGVPKDEVNKTNVLTGACSDKKMMSLHKIRASPLQSI
jgi:hypothetical protein